MKNKILTALLAGIVFPMVMNAQGPEKKSSGCGCSFSSVNQVGVLEGETGSALQLQTINGIRYNKWFAGIGVGLDHYRVRSVPVFIDVRRNLFSRSNSPFAYGNFGVNIPWAEDKNKMQWGSNSFHSGLYYDAGIGYRFGLGKKTGLVFSGGFSLKQMREYRSSEVVCFRAPCPEAETDRYHFSLKRFSFKAGIQL